MLEALPLSPRVPVSRKLESGVELSSGAWVSFLFFNLFFNFSGFQVLLENSYKIFQRRFDRHLPLLRAG